MGRVHPYFSFSFCPIIFLCVTNLLHKKGQKRAPIVKRVLDFNVKNNSFPICLQSGADDLWTQTTLQNNDDDEKKQKKKQNQGQLVLFHKVGFEKLNWKKQKPKKTDEKFEEQFQGWKRSRCGSSSGISDIWIKVFTHLLTKYKKWYKFTQCSDNILINHFVRSKLDFEFFFF